MGKSSLLLFVLVALSGAWLSPQRAAAASQDVVPPVGPPGTEFSFYATGFTAEEDVGFWATAPDGRVLGDDGAYRAKAGERGRVDWRWAAPGDAADGQWLMSVRGVLSGFEQVIPFQIGSAAPPSPSTAPAPTILASPASGPPGTTFSFYAVGFYDREKVGYWATAPNFSTVGNDRAYNVRSNPDGRADWTWTAPRNAAPGPWLMTAQGDESKVIRSIRIEIH